MGRGEGGVAEYCVDVRAHVYAKNQSRLPEGVVWVGQLAVACAYSIDAVQLEYT